MLTIVVVRKINFAGGVSRESFRGDAVNPILILSFGNFRIPPDGFKAMAVDRVTRQYGNDKHGLRRTK